MSGVHAGGVTFRADGDEPSAHFCMQNFLRREPELLPGASNICNYDEGPRLEE